MGRGKGGWGGGGWHMVSLAGVGGHESMGLSWTCNVDDACRMKGTKSRRMLCK